MPQNQRRVAVSLNLGPDVPIETISGVLSDLSAVCQFSGNLQEHVSRAQAVKGILRNPEPWLPDAQEMIERFRRSSRYLQDPGALPPFQYDATDLERAIASYMNEYQLDHGADVHVERIEYRNPLEIILGLGYVAYLLLNLVQDSSARRRINDATASDYEDIVRTRKQVRRAVADRLISGEQPVSPELINDLLTDDAVQGFRNLASNDFKLSELEARTENNGGEGDQN
jgi:hypothetical protein